jgi:hypothetical protein
MKRRSAMAISNIVKQAEGLITQTESREYLDWMKSHYLGKTGLLVSELNKLDQYPLTDRSSVGLEITRARKTISTLINKKRKIL